MLEACLMKGSLRLSLPPQNPTVNLIIIPPASSNPQAILHPSSSLTLLQSATLVSEEYAFVVG